MSVPMLQATENFNAESTNSKIQKSHAVNEAGRLRTELESVRRDKDQVRMLALPLPLLTGYSLVWLGFSAIIALAV